MEKTQSKLYSKEGYQMMAAAFEVHNVLGGGLAEEVYQESLEIELEGRGIPYRSKQEIIIHYKGRELKKKYVPDLYCYDEVVVELKAVSQLAPEHEAQLLNYMRLTKKLVGYLINFGPLEGAEWKRFVL